MSVYCRDYSLIIIELSKMWDSVRLCLSLCYLSPCRCDEIRNQEGPSTVRFVCPWSDSVTLTWPELWLTVTNKLSPNPSLLPSPGISYLTLTSHLSPLPPHHHWSHQPSENTGHPFLLPPCITDHPQPGLRNSIKIIKFQTFYFILHFQWFVNS